MALCTLSLNSDKERKETISECKQLKQPCDSKATGDRTGVQEQRMKLTGTTDNLGILITVQWHSSYIYQRLMTYLLLTNESGPPMLFLPRMTVMFIYVSHAWRLPTYSSLCVSLCLHACKSCRLSALGSMNSSIWSTISHARVTNA